MWSDAECSRCRFSTTFTSPPWVEVGIGLLRADLPGLTGQFAFRVQTSSWNRRPAAACNDISAFLWHGVPHQQCDCRPHIGL